MDDQKLFELAVTLTTADIQSSQIGPATMGRQQMIEDRIVSYHDMLRRLWREQHRTDNVEPMSP